MHQLFTTNPDLLQFCTQAGIYDQVNLLLESRLNENHDVAISLIRETEIPQTLIIGNGDVLDYKDGLSKAHQVGVDGIMIGRGIFKNPLAFLPLEQQLELDTRENRIGLLLEHLESWEKTWGDIKTLKKQPGFVPNSPANSNLKNFASMKKFVKMYISNFPGALDLRVQFMNLNTSREMIELCKKELDLNLN
jgi:tRNA-dihydrouridine synthase